MDQQKFYITTPIYYGTAAPHLGSLYSTLLADVLARWQRLKGIPVCFLTGTDEHGQKVEQAAQKAGKKPQEFVDQFIPAYKNLWRDYNISHTRFIRTTDPHHIKAVQAWLEKVKQQGDIYKSVYSGWYCTPCETYVTEQLNGQEKAPVCPQCTRETASVSEECYFFRLSAYQDKLLEFYKNNPNFITPKERYAEVIKFVESGLRDLSISRTTISWGVPFPGDEKHVVYVWADALTNYISAVGYGDSERKAELNFWWPADVHVLGKDIVRFHAVFWPAFLMAAELEPPHQLLVHGWIKIGEQKMSKSLGNVVDPAYLYKTYGVDVVRYYLVRQFSIGHDGQFSFEDLENRISHDLANDLGNLVNRFLTLAHQYDVLRLSPVEQWSNESLDLAKNADACFEQYIQFMNHGNISLAIAAVWKYIGLVNAYFHRLEPWKRAKDDKKTFEEVLLAVAHSLQRIAIALFPIMPDKMQTLLLAIGKEICQNKNYVQFLHNNQWASSFELSKIDPLFQKIEKVKEVQMQSSENAKIDENNDGIISIDDVSKVDMRVGTIISCEPIVKSDKLLRLEVDFGPLGRRQILAGVRKLFSVDQLLNKQALFVVNLKPRKMMGMESQGMLLVLKQDDKAAAFLAPSYHTSNGLRAQ